MHMQHLKVSMFHIKLTDQRMDAPMVKLMVFGTICEMGSMGIERLPVKQVQEKHTLAYIVL